MYHTRKTWGDIGNSQYHIYTGINFSPLGYDKKTTEEFLFCIAGFSLSIRIETNHNEGMTWVTCNLIVFILDLYVLTHMCSRDFCVWCYSTNVYHNVHWSMSCKTIAIVFSLQDHVGIAYFFTTCYVSTHNFTSLLRSYLVTIFICQCWP